MTWKWIISRREDLTWLIGPAAASFAILAGYFGLTAGMGISAAIVVPVLFIMWSLLFDGTHVFATYTRTFFDREFAQHSRSILRYSLVFLVAGPALILFFYLTAGVEGARGFFIIFNRFGLGWAYYHLIRQHWGFVSLYRRKNAETDLLGRRLDALLLAFGSVFPFVYYQAHYPQTAHTAELVTISSATWQTVMANLWIVAALSGAASVLLLRIGSSATEGGKMFRALAVIASIVAVGISISAISGYQAILDVASQALLIAFAVTVAAQVVYAAMRSRKGETFNAPKWLCLAIVLATHNAVLLLLVPFLVAVVCLTIFHNVQYHRIVQFHNANQYGQPEASTRFGFAAVLAQRLALYVCLALVYSLFTTVPRAAAATLIDNPMLNFALTAFFWGIAFNHYYLDAIIWRPRASTQLAQSLRVPDARVTP